MVIIDKQNMLVLIVENNKDPKLKRIPNRLNTLRRIVGNEHIEVIKYKDVLIVYDEEAFKKLLPINRIIKYKRKFCNNRKRYKKSRF